MTFYPQAVQQPSMYKALMQGLQGYQAVKGIQQQSAASERADAAEKRAALGQTAATERQQKYDDIADKERFAKESSQFAATIRELPTEKKIQRIQERISDLDGRGIPSDTTKRLLDMYQQGTTGVQQARSMEEAEMLGAKVKEADDAIEQRYQMGIQQGYVKAPAKTKGQYRFATPEEKQQAGITDEAPYQVSPKGQFVKLGGKGQTINVNTGQKAGGDAGIFAKELAKKQVKDLGNVQQAALDAESQLFSLDQIDAMDVKQGALEPMKMQLGAIGESLGLDMSSVSNVAAGQAYMGAATKMVLNQMAMQKGPQTKEDVQQIKTTVADLGNSPQANKFLTGAVRAQSLRKTEQRDFYEQYLEDHGNQDGVSKAWNKYKRDVPMIARNIKVDGIPVFFHTFEKTMRENNPDMSREDIINFWKEKDKAAKKQPKKPQIPINSLPRPIPLSINTRVTQQQPGQPGDQLRQGLAGRYGL